MRALAEVVAALGVLLAWGIGACAVAWAGSALIAVMSSPGF